MKVRFREKGSSLIEALVAVGILGMLAYFVVGLLKTGTTGQKTLQAQDDARSLTDNMATVVADQVACQNTFAGLSPTLNPKGTTVTDIKDSIGNSVYSVGKDYGNRNLTLTGILVGGTDPTDPKTGLPLWSPVGSPTTTGGTAFVQVEWTQKGGTQNSAGPAKLIRFFLLNVLNMNSGTTIKTCTAQVAGSGSGYWTYDNGSHNIYNNNNNGAGGVGIGIATPTGIFDVYAGSGHALTVIASGNVGIGTTSPSYRLTVADAPASMVFGNEVGASIFRLQNSSSDSISAVSLANSTKEYQMRVDGSLGNLFSIYDVASASPRLVILPSGNVGIGTTSPQQLLDVSGNVQAQSFLYSSDVRLKKDIKSLDGYDLARKLEGVAFTWKNNGQRDIGLIAQEVEKVVPELVVTDANGMKSVKYGNIAAILVEAFKRQDQQVRELKQQNLDLELRLRKFSLRLDRLDGAKPSP